MTPDRPQDTRPNPAEEPTGDDPAWEDPRLRIPDVLRPQPPKPPPPSSNFSARYSDVARAWALAFDFVGTILVGALLGWLFDRWRGTLPWGVLVGLAFGFVGAFIRIVRATNRPPPRR